MKNAFTFDDNPQVTIVDSSNDTSVVIGKNSFAEDGVTVNLSSDPKEIARFSGTERHATGNIDITGTIATILQGDDLWGLLKAFQIRGIVTSTLSNGKTGAQIGGADSCVVPAGLEVIIEGACRNEADVEKRIKLTNVQFNAEDVELAINNSDGVTPEIAFYANSDDDDVKALFGFDDDISA